MASTRSGRPQGLRASPSGIVGKRSSGGDAQHGEIGARVAQHDLGVELAPVDEGDPHLLHALDPTSVVRDD